LSEARWRSGSSAIRAGRIRPLVYRGIFDVGSIPAPRRNVERADPLSVSSTRRRPKRKRPCSTRLNALRHRKYSRPQGHARRKGAFKERASARREELGHGPAGSIGLQGEAQGSRDYSIPHTLIRRPLTLVAAEHQVRVLDGTTEVAGHPRTSKTPMKGENEKP